MPCVLHGAVRLVAAFTGTMSTVLRRTRPGERADLFFPDVNPECEATNRLLYHCTAVICSIPLSVENDTVRSKEITSPLSVVAGTNERLRRSRRWLVRQRVDSIGVYSTSHGMVL
jgi:hypothetical protein